MPLRLGLVVRTHGGHYYVRQDRGGAFGEIIDCRVRGRLKKERIDSDIVAVGDLVRWSALGDGRGVIEQVLPRRSALSRCVRTGTGYRR